MSFSEWSNNKKKKKQGSSFSEWSDSQHKISAEQEREDARKREAYLASREDDIAPVRDTLTIETTQDIYDKYGKYFYESDFADLSKPTGSKQKDVGWKFWEDKGDDVYDFINDINKYRLAVGSANNSTLPTEDGETYRDAFDRMLLAQQNGHQNYGMPDAGAPYGDYTKYSHMTKFEVAVYNYLYSSKGKDAAQEFLNDLEFALTYRQGATEAEEIQGLDSGIYKTLRYTEESIGGGLEQFGIGVKQLFSEEQLPTTAGEITNALLLEDLDGWKKNLYSAGNVIGNMTPSLAVGAINPTAGMALQGASGGGNAYRQALAEGKTEGEAKAYGVMMGSMEFLTSKLLGGVAGMTGNLPSKALSKVSTFSNSLLRVGAKYGISLASEVTEEELQLWLEPAVRSIAFGEDYDAPELEEMAETAIVTMISTGVLNSSTDIATGQFTKVNGLSVNEAKVIEAEVNNRVADAEADGKKLTGKEKEKIRDKVVAEAQRGYISTDTIESVLGGKSYENYKNLAEQKPSLESRKTEIEDEIKELVKTPELQFTIEQRERYDSLREEARGIKEQIKGIETAKTNLFNEVDKLTSKDTLLRESYNEIIRKTQDIDIDENQYNGTKFADAAKKTIENARKANANNSNRVRDFVEFSAKYSSQSGVVVDFRNENQIKQILENQLKSDIAKETDEAKLAELQDTLKQVQEGKIKVNGVKTKNGVAINLESPNYLNAVLGHEVTHFLEGTGDAYKKLQEIAFRLAKQKGDYEGRRKIVEILYKNVEGTTVDQELTADLIGDYLFTEYDFIKSLSTENRNVFQKVYDKIKHMFKLATAGSKEARELEKLMHQFEKALRESVEVSQSVEQNEGATQFSLRTKPAPKKTQEVYKLMRLKDGEIYPLFIDSTEPLKIGEWYDADSPNLDFLKEMPSGVFLVDANNGTYQSFDEYLQESGERKTKYPSKNAIEKATAEGKRWVFIEDTAKAQKRFDGETRKYWNIGINGSGSVSTFSMRPGYHAGSLPTMRQIGKGANRDLRDDSFVWTVGEVPADIDYQAEADMNPDKDIPTHIPEDGYYLKATNADKAKSQADRVGWYVSGGYKINRVISDSEARQVIDDWNKAHPDMPVEYDYERESGMDFDADLMKLVPKSDNPLGARYSLSRNIDKSNDLGYNGNDLYTATDEFVVDVAKNDRDAFSRSLANKTADLAKDEIRTVEIYGANKVYFFKATGYMQGRVLYSANVEDGNEYRTVKKELYDGNNSSRKTFGSWSSVFPFDGTGTRSDIHSVENGRTESDVYDVYGESRTSNSTGTQERIRQNFRDDPEEVERILVKLREKYGNTETSSTSDVFFDGENADVRYSLSQEGENRKLGGSYRFDGKDFTVKSDIAPVREDVAPDTPTAENVTAEEIPMPTDADAPMQSETVAEDTAFDAPMLENIPVLPDEELEQGAYAAIRPKPTKEPSMKKVEGSVDKPHGAQVLTEEPKTEKKKKSILSSAVRNLVDKGAVFENLSLKTKNRALQDTYKAMGRSEAKAQYFMENGTENVKPLDAIRAEVEKTGKTKEFYEYLYHKHNVDRMSLESRERPNLERLTSKMEELKLLHLEGNQLRAIASEKITHNTTPERAELVKTVREYLKSKAVKNKPVFDYTVTARMSQEAAKQYEVKNPEFKAYAQDVYDYMNHLRQMMVYNGVISPETAELWAKTYPYYVPIRRVDKNGSPIDVPLYTNRTGINAPIKRATGGNSDILPLFNTMALRTSQTFKAIDKNRFGIELKDTLGGVTENTATSLDEVIDSIDTHESLLQEGKDGKSPTFTVFEGGERVTFDITDEMYEALKPAEGLLAATSKVLNTASNLHRGVLTEYSVPFMVTNAIKDAQDLLINSQHPAKTYAKIPAAINELRKHGKWYTEYMENGGGDITYFDKQTNTFNKEKSKLRKIIGFPLDKISDANNFIEKVPRLAEYIASRESGVSVDGAMLDAARVTTDFSAGGDVTKFFNRNGVTFLNASVQGLAQQVRNVREAKMNGLKGWLGLATKIAIAGLPAMLLNGLLWDDDEEYEELSDYVKENYYIVGKYGDGKFVRIPKGRTLAVIQNGFEQIRNSLTGDDEADFGRFFDLFLSNLAPNNPLDSNIIAPIKQVMENKTWYGEDLVPTRLQDLPAAEQYDESTDAISKWLGEKTNTSPYKINYLLNQYSGGVGDIFLPMLTPEAESGDNSLLGNFIAPLKDKFTTDSVMNNQNVSDFYDTVDSLTTNAKSSYATDEDILKSKYINSVSTELGDLYKAKREIQNSSLSDSVKYSQVRSIQEQINNLAKDALNSYERINIQGDYATVGDKHYRLDDGVWTKISDKQLERQREVTAELGISPSEYWSKTDISYFPNSDGEFEYAYDNPGKYAVSKVVGGYDTYKTYSKELYNIKADKDSNGKSISGSRKEKVLDYINNLDLDYGAKIILFKSEYPSDNTYNYDIIDYLNNHSDLTYEDRVTIYRELGFRVTSDGRIYAE